MKFFKNFKKRTLLKILRATFLWVYFLKIVATVTFIRSVQFQRRIVMGGNAHKSQRIELQAVR